MNSSERRAPLLRGIVPPLVTPLLEPDRIDEGGLDRLLSHVMAGGAHGLFILGSTGEAPHLDYRLRREVIKLTCRQVNRRLPVLVGITDTSLNEAVALARFAADAGADALVAAAPYYFPLTQSELYDFFRGLSAQAPLPLFLYNMPAMTKMWFEHDTLTHLAQLPQICGLKDSSGDMAYFAGAISVARARPDWRVFVGQDNLLLQAIQAGGHGGVLGGAEIAPKLFVQVYEAANKPEQAPEVQSRVTRLGRIYSIGGTTISGYLRAIKCALSLMGICGDAMAAPFSPLSETQREQVRGILRELELVS